MKLILSRKGFDSAAGKVPSPLFPDGTMISLPIPDKHKTITYAEIAGNYHAGIGDLVKDLAGMSEGTHAHLDPDLSPHSLPRSDGWRPIFGQTGTAEKHLQNHDVDRGDVFLFFGLFRHVERRDGRWMYVKGSRPLHVIFGWLQIDERIRISDWPTERTWATYHPQFWQPSSPLNVMYVSSDRLTLPGLSADVPGAGLFPAFRPDLQLTDENRGLKGPSSWLLPKCFERQLDTPSLSYHKKRDRWSRREDGVLLSSAGRGQEFVLDCDQYPGVVSWLGELLGGGDTQ